MNFQMFKLDLVKAEEPEIKLPTSAGSSKNKRVPEKHLFLLYWLCQSLWLCGSQYTVENSERDENTRPSDLFLRNLYAGQEATVRTGHGNMSMPGHAGRCRSGSKLELDMEICPCGEKYQEPQICRWHHPYGSKRRRTKEPPDARGEWKS